MSTLRHDNIEVRAPKPLDSRETVATFTDLALIPVQYRYIGLTSFVADANVEYWLETDISTWVLKSTGGGGASG